MSTVQSYLAASGSTVALRMEEMRQKEARDKESAAVAAAEKLAELRRTVEIAAVDWEAEVLLAIEKIPGLLNAVRPMVLAGVQPPRKAVGKEGVIWVDSIQQPRRLFDPKCLYEESCPVLVILRGIHYGFTEADVPKEATLLCEQARFRVRLLTRVFHSLQEQAVTEAATEAAAKAAEEARVAAEKKAFATAAYEAAMEEQRIRMNAQVHAYIVRHPNIHTLQHNFTDTHGASTLFAAYRINKARPTGVVATTAKAFLEVLNVTPYTGITPALPEHATTFQIPAAWASHYEEGRLPFLTICPTCGKAPAIRKLRIHDSIGNACGHTMDVECWEHYRWNPDNNQHYKWVRFPPRPAHTTSCGFRPDGHWVLWDPKDPEGVKAVKAAKDKQIAEKEEQIRKLQEELLSLR